MEELVFPPTALGRGSSEHEREAHFFCAGTVPYSWETSLITLMTVFKSNTARAEWINNFYYRVKNSSLLAATKLILNATSATQL